MEDIKVPAGEDNNTETEPTTVVTDATETKKEETIGDVLGTTEKKEPRVVPESVLIEYKKENKELMKEVKGLRKAIEDGASKKEVSSNLQAIADEYGIDPQFLNKLTETIKAEAEANAEEKISSKLKPIEEKDKQTKIDEIFNQHYQKIIETMPEYQSIVNKDVIKTLTLDPKNANKSFEKIIEESYGHLVPGKKTMEPTKPRGGSGDAEIDFAKAKSDGEYFAQIMSDPILKQKYNADLAKRISL